MTPWTRTADRLPERGQRVEWIRPDGLHERGQFSGVFWFADGAAMCVDYVPEFWRAIE